MTSMTTQIHVMDQWREIAAVVDRYEDAVGDQLPDVATFLEGVSAPNRGAALLELLQVEQEHRWGRRQGKTVEEYLAQYPELRADCDAVRQLARWECRLRCGAGDHTFRQDFSRRFPDLELECETLPGAATTVPTRSSRCRCCPQVRPKQIGRYAVEARIGGGAFGVVYRCRHPELDRLVAIKLTRGGSHGAAAFLHEAQNVAGLAHANIVGLLDYGKLDDGRPYIVYEYVAGRTLADRIAARDYTLGEAIHWTIALAGALQAAHRRRIYHRDIKPANILVDEEGVVRLTDFGLARRDDLFYVDDRGMQLGTPAYMSPEQASGRSEWAGPAADIYSLGVVFYELLCGRVPFRDKDLNSLVEQIKERPPVPLRSADERIPARIEDACLRALQKDPAKRFRTAGDFARALQTAIEPRSRRRWLVAAAAAMLVVLGIIGIVAYRDMHSGDDTVAKVLKLNHPRIDVVRNGNLKEVSPQNLPRGGDQIRFFAQLAEGKGHLYVILLGNREPARVLWPDPKSIQDSAVEHFVFCPAQERFLSLPPGEGVMTVLVGARREPLPAAVLDPLTAAGRFHWPAPPNAAQLREFAQFPATAGNPADESEYLIVRGSSDPTAFDLPSDFKKEVERVFETYYAVMLPWYDAPSQASSSAP